jgi:hypothetical protein
MDFQSTGVLSHDPCQLQYNLHCEEMIRKNPGEVQRRGFNLKPIDNNSVEHAFKLAIKIGDAGHCKVIEDGSYRRYFLSEKWACRLGFDIQVAGTDTVHTINETECAESKPSEGEAVSGKPVIRVIEVEIYSASPSNFDNLEKWCKDSGYRITHGFESTDGIPVVFAWPTKNGIDYRQQSFDKIPLEDIKCNYSENVIDSVTQLLEYMNQVTHGLVVLSGPVGTGKSYLIRSILSEMTQRRAVVCTPATHFLEEAGLLTQVVANFQKSIVVLEDVGEVIAIDAATRYVDARSNLLNFAEGFLSLLTDAIIVVSFNYDVDKIDPAVLRPGRCLARIEVKDLPFEQANELVDFDIPNRNYSLAEVYEMRRTGKPIKKETTARVGFS